MRLTKEQLKQIIKEEIDVIMNEASPKDIDDAIKDLLGSTESADIEEIVDDLPQYGNDSDRQDIMDELEDLIEKEEVEKFEDKSGDTMYRLVQNLEEQDVEQKINLAKSKTKRIADNLRSELETTAEESGLDTSTLENLVMQYMKEQG
mgnify:CR=1 FL=1